MYKEIASPVLARVLAELIDTALADDWNEDEPAMALLWQASDDPDDLLLALKRLKDSVEEEFAPLADDGSYLAVAHSTVTPRPPAELLPQSDVVPTRITVADHKPQSGVVRYRNGTTQWFGAVDLPVVRLVRSLLWLEPACLRATP